MDCENQRTYLDQKCTETQTGQDVGGKNGTKTMNSGIGLQYLITEFEGDESDGQEKQE